MTANKLALFLAQGLGIGRIPIIPGTFGSWLGFLWFLLIVAPGNFAIFATAILFSFFVSVLCSEIGEQVLHQKDPNSIVIDEIIAKNPDKAEQARTKPAMIGWFVGQVMRASGCKANPQAVNELLKTKLGLA